MIAANSIFCWLRIADANDMGVCDTHSGQAGPQGEMMFAYETSGWCGLLCAITPCYHGASWTILGT